MHKLVLLGELDRASTATLEAAIEGLCETEVEGITLDLSELTHVDATGVAVIVFRCRWCQRRGYEFALIPGPPAVQRVFELTGACERLPFVEREATAQTVAGDESSVSAITTQPALVCAPAGPRSPGRLSAASRPRSVTLLRVSGRRARARRTRRRRGGR